MERILTKEPCNYHSKSLDHFGLVSGICEELEIAKLIDQEIPCLSTHKKVSYGQAVVAMVINGLRFTNKTLYLPPDFFNKRPIERLFEGAISAQDLNDDVLGRTLDAIFEYNPTELFSFIAARTVSKLNLTCKTGHLDSTSFHVDGEYNSAEKPDEQAQIIHITPGYSRDHRPELNQVVLNMIVKIKHLYSSRLGFRFSHLALPSSCEVLHKNYPQCRTATPAVIFTQNLTS